MNLIDAINDLGMPIFSYPHARRGKSFYNAHRVILEAHQKPGSRCAIIATNLDTGMRQLNIVKDACDRNDIPYTLKNKDKTIEFENGSIIYIDFV